MFYCALFKNILLPDDISTMGMFRAGGSGAISLQFVLSLKNLIYQLGEISNNKLIFLYLRRGGAPSGASSMRRRRLNFSRP